MLPRALFAEDSPNERVTLGVIGSGGKATGGMRNFMAVPGVEVVAVCDVNAKNRNRAADIAGVPEDRRYVDFRDLLARPDIDAVLIGTPDHWHVLCAIAAAQAGKHIYCEKPLSNTVAEGRALVEAVERSGVVFQHGTQLRSLEGTRRACELVRNGYLGDVKSVTIGSPPGQVTGYHPPQPVPDWLAYDLWLGPAPELPYVPQRVLHPGWYFWDDYSKAGWIAGYGVHDIDLAQWGLGTELTGPVAIEGEGKFPEGGTYNTVTTYRLVFTYADGRKITMVDTGQHKHGVTFHGSEGQVHTRSGIEASDPKLLGIRLSSNDQRLYSSQNHERNLIDCIRTGKQTITPIEVAHRSTSITLIGGICVKLGRKLHWDPVTETFPGDDEANRLLSYAMRAPWRV
jgi:predicted dehydrogenase